MPTRARIPLFLDALASLDFKLSVSQSGMFLQLAHLRDFQIILLNFGNLFSQSTLIIIEWQTLLSTSIIMYAKFGRQFLAFLTSCHPF